MNRLGTRIATRRLVRALGRLLAPRKSFQRRIFSSSRNRLYTPPPMAQNISCETGWRSERAARLFRAVKH